jgi:CDP-diacylglycerol---glycerol-3-phosphate 3-phosphatidyltransferase
MISYTKRYIPLYLTTARLLISPVLLPFLLVYLLPYNSGVINTVLALIFMLFGLTDFLDGYLARKYKYESQLGKILDPIADKSMVYSTLIALLVVRKIYFFWVIILIGREFFMMGVRIVAKEYNKSVAVSGWGKAKTIAQVTLLTFLIGTPYQEISFSHAPVWHSAEWLLLGITLLLSVTSAVLYYVHFIALVSDTTLFTKGDEKE